MVPMEFETGRAAAAKKWIASAYVETTPLRRFIDAFPDLRFYRAGNDDDLGQKADVVLPSWYSTQRRSLIGPCMDEAGAVWDARLRFGGCDYPMRHEEHFRCGGARDWFVLTHFGFASDEDRRHLLGACGLLPIGVRFGYHLHLAINLHKPTDKRIYVVHLDEIGDELADRKVPKPEAAFKSYGTMLASIVEVRKGGDGEVVKAKKG